MMSFHPEKCNVLTVSRKKNIIKRDYILHGHQLEQVTSAKYIGVTISSDLRWNVHIANMSTSDVIVKYMIVSSANSLIVDRMLSGISFM
jgi:hypothetical protein